MKNKDFYVYITAFVYILFSYAVILPPGVMTLDNWIITLALNFTVTVLTALITVNNRKILPLADLILLIYILFLISRTIAGMNSYMKVYHRQSPVWVNIVITTVLIIILCRYKSVETEKLAMPVCVLALFILVMIVFLNIFKANPANLYSNNNISEAERYNVTMFDFIIPMAVILNYRNSANRKRTLSFIFLTGFTLISVTIFIFSCIKGNLLYSISPLQMAFQISSGTQISNFDAYYSFFLWFCYFGSIILLMEAWRCIKTRFIYFNSAELFLVIPLVMINSYIPDVIYNILFLIAAAFMALGRRKVGYYEKV